MTRLEFVFRVLMGVLALCLCIQLVVDPSYENMISVVLVCLSLSGLALYLRLSRPFVDTPVSSLSLVGFGMTSMLAALVSQSAQATSFIQLLRDPVLTFSVLSMTMVTAIAMHWCYRRFGPFHAPRDGLARHILSPMGLHDVPYPALLWCMGVIGLGPLVSGSASIGDVGGKFFQAFEFLVWAPFLIPVFWRQFGPTYCNLKAQLPLLAVFAGVIVVIAIGRNARQLMFIGPVIAALIYFVIAMRDPSPMPRKSIVRVLTAAVLGMVAIVLVADLATAMVLVRDKREGASTKEMIKETFYALQDRQRILEYRQQGHLKAVTHRYDEAYLSNPVLNRLSETKFHDNMLYFGNRMDVGQKDEILDALGNKVLSIFPQPLLDRLDVDFRKYEHMYSMGDVYVTESIGGSLGGYYSGSLWADIWLFFGPFYVFAVAVLLLPVFIVLDALARFDGDHFISPLAFCMAWTLFIYGLGGDSMAAKLAFLLRDLPQRVILYALVLAGLKFLFRRGVHRPARLGIA